MVKASSKHQAQTMSRASISTIIRTSNSLRYYGKKLAKHGTKSISNSNAFDRLLRELQAGELSASILLTENGPFLKLKREFWHTVDERRMKQILAGSKKAFEIQPYEIAPQLEAELQNRPDLLLPILSRRNGYEPFISDASWDDYLRRHDEIDVSAARFKGKQGRKESSRWKDVAALLLAMLIKGNPQNGSNKSIKSDITSLASTLNLGGPGWPQDRSLDELVSRGVDMSTKLEKSSARNK